MLQIELQVEANWKVFRIDLECSKSRNFAPNYRTPCCDFIMKSQIFSNTVFFRFHLTSTAKKMLTENHLFSISCFRQKLTLFVGKKGYVAFFSGRYPAYLALHGAEEQACMQRKPRWFWICWYPAPYSNWFWSTRARSSKISFILLPNFGNLRFIDIIFRFCVCPAIRHTVR